MTYHVVIPPSVERLILEQARYLRSEGAGDTVILSWLEELYAKFEPLRTYPRLYAVAELISQSRGYEVRRINHRDYAIFYRVRDEPQVVEVLDFRRGRRDGR